MITIYKTRLKILFKNKMMTFWTLFFPIALSIFFYAALKDVYKANPLDTIPVAIVSSSESFSHYETFKNAIESAEISENKKLFSVFYSSEENAVKKLNEGSISSYILWDGELKMIVRDSGINQSVTKLFLEGFIQKQYVQSQIQPSEINLPIETINSSFINYSKEMKTQPDMVLNYFYALIAMSCLFASSYGLREITDTQANLSSTAARINVTGKPKYKFIISSLLAAFTIQVLLCVLLLAFLMFVLKIDFGNRILLVLFTTILSCLFGLFFGAFVGASSSKSEDLKSSIIIAFSLGGCFLSGLMIPPIKFLIEHYAPFLRYINPANLITDALYSLYYYENLNRFYVNISILSVFIIILAFLTYIFTRRCRYASL